MSMAALLSFSRTMTVHGIKRKEMKRLLYILLPALALVSCSKNQPDVSDDCNQVFRVSELTTRAAFAADDAGNLTLAWEADDRIGISASCGEALVGVNYPYMFRSGSHGVLEPASAMYRYDVAQSQRTYYAYYPYAGEPSEGVHYLTPVSLANEQKYDPAAPVENLRNFWVMKSEPYTLTDAASAVDLSFKGVFSIVELRLKYDKAAAKAYPLEKVILKSAGDPLSFTAGNLKLDTSAQEDAASSPIIINAAVDSVALMLDNTVTLSDTEEYIFCFVVAPGRHEAEELSVILTTDNQYKTVVKIADGVTFKPNTVYRKSVTVDSKGFVSTKPEGEKEEVTVYVPVSAPDGLTDGEYIMAMDHTDGNRYILPNTPVELNPVLTSPETAGIQMDENGNIISVSDTYLWSLNKSGEYWKITCVHDGRTYHLISANKAQGLAVSEDMKGNYEAETYDDLWKVVLNGTDVCMQVSKAASNRWMVAWTDTGQFRLTAASGSWKFYRKTTILQ